MDVIGFLCVSLGSRRASHVQRLVSVVKMATVHEEHTTEEQRWVVRFCGQNDLVQRTLIKKCFLFTVGSVCRVKRFTTGLTKAANVSLIKKTLKRRCGSGWDNSKKTSMLRVSTHW
jgi:hypothetical protein